MEELRVPVDFIVGTSMGAIVGGLYASGVSPAEMERRFAEIDWADGEWIVDEESGEQMWQPAGGGEAISQADWEKMVSENEGEEE